MWRGMKADGRFTDRAMPLLWAAILGSFAFWVIVLLLGFHRPIPGTGSAYKPYFEQINWWPYPLFFLALAPGLWLTWTPFLHAWRRLAETEVLRHSDGEQPDAEVLADVREAVRRRRYLAVILALLVSMIVNVTDRMHLVDLYSGRASIEEQQTYACSDLGPFSKWVFDNMGGPEAICTGADGGPLAGDAAVDATGVPAPIGQIAFASISALQQFLIVFLAALAVLQILLHTALFGVFEHLAVARKHNLHLALNSRSPLNEFGLEHWNHALNNFYWAVCPALFGVFMSRASTAPEDYLPGQVMLGIVVPACLLAPMIATIIVRQARLPATWEQLQPHGPVPPQDYRRQQLWPLDRNWTSKLGIVLAFALAALSIGFELSQFVRF